MLESTETNTIDPSAPTTAQVDAMWLALRAAEAAEAAAHRRSVERIRRSVNAWIYGEAA